MEIKNRIRKCNFSMRVQEIEDILLDLRKDEAGMTKAEYLRNIILFAPARERSIFADSFVKELYEELNIVGQNLNVIAHAVNCRGMVIRGDIHMLEQEYTNLYAVYDKFVRDKVKNPY